jgi:ParB/RepB/Spo0J family partition protein
MPPTPTPWPVLEGIEPVTWVDLMSRERRAMSWEDWRDRFIDKLSRAGLRAPAPCHLQSEDRMTTETTSRAVAQIAIDELHDSPFNPRKRFDDVELRAARDQRQGRGHPAAAACAAAPESALCRRSERRAGFEIIYGHRRKRAAILAGLSHVPVEVVAASDAECKRWQIAENLQRVDVHPIEEAEGFQALIDEHGETAERIADSVGKSRSYVYGRLKLLEAAPEIRKACLAGEIGSEVALLFARLRTPKLQEKALAKIKGEAYRFDMPDGGARSFRAIRDMLVEKFTLELKSAIFATDSAELVPAAGSCSSCPKRSGNAPEFDDITTGENRGQWSRVYAGADVCTDPECFDAKKTAHLRAKAAELQGKGTTVIAGNAARQAIGADGVVKGAFVALADVKDALKAKVATVAIQDPRTGKIVKAVRRDDAKRAGAKVDAVHRRAAASTMKPSARSARPKRRDATRNGRSSTRCAWPSCSACVLRSRARRAAPSTCSCSPAKRCRTWHTTTSPRSQPSGMSQPTSSRSASGR